MKEEVLNSRSERARIDNGELFDEGYGKSYYVAIDDVAEIETDLNAACAWLSAAVRELNQVTVVTDGQPNVSHNLIYNINQFLAQMESKK